VRWHVLGRCLRLVRLSFWVRILRFGIRILSIFHHTVSPRKIIIITQQIIII
jgi:hypothetical protein